MAVRADAVMLAGGCALRKLGVSFCVNSELGDDIGFTYRGGGWGRYGGGGSMVPFGTPGMGLLGTSKNEEFQACSHLQKKRLTAPRGLLNCTSK